MSDYRRMRKHYNEVFDRLQYQNKAVMNEVFDYLKRKKLNRLAQKQILTEIAEMVLDCQNRDISIDALFEDNRDAFCDRMSETAPPASIAEKILSAVRYFAGVVMLIFFIITIESSAARGQTLEDFAWGFLFWAFVVAGIFVFALLCELYLAKKNYSLNSFSKLHDANRINQNYNKQ